MASGYKNQKPESLPSNLQKSAHQKTLNLKRNIEMLVLLNEGKRLLHIGAKVQKVWRNEIWIMLVLRYILYWTTNQKCQFDMP